MEGLTPASTLQEYLDSRRNKVPFSLRLQWKTAHRVLSSAGHSVSYDRAKALALFGSAPESKEEEREAKVIRWHLANLESPSPVSLSGEPLQRMPKAAKGETLLGICGKAVSWAASCTKDEVEAALLERVCLLKLGLIPPGHRKSGPLSPFDADELCLALLSTPEPNLPLPPLEVEEVKERVRLAFSGTHVDRVFVYGSYAKGEQVEGSDVDLLVRFDSGLRQEEKLASISLARERFQSMGMIIDLHDIILGDGEHPGLEDYFEVELA